MSRHLIAVAWVVGGLLAHGAPMAGELPTGELRLQWEERQMSAQGPLAEALARAPEIVNMTPRTPSAQLELKHSARLPTPGGLPRLTLHANALARHEWPRAASPHDASRVNELNLSTELGSFGLSAGKKVLGWDVGYAFRPNDVVQQEERRSLAGTTPEGRPLLMLEHFGRASALSLVWANPNASGRTQQRAPGAQESALAARAYWRAGTLDVHAFARVGERNGASLGAAAAWVPGESTEWHASWRGLRRHEGWAMSTPTPAAVLAADPWRSALHGPTSQWLVGMNFTGSAQQSLMLEAWHDGTAPSNATWRAWGSRNAALLASAAPTQAVAGNLAWQTRPFNSANLRQDNLFARLSWQPGPWQLWLDALCQPADRGLSLSAGLQWQGDAWKLAASWRHHGGRAGSVLAQLPYRTQALASATLAF